MPRLSDSMEEGTILEWLKADGDAVERGEDLLEIETDKAALVYQADQSGVLHIIAAVGDAVPVSEAIEEAIFNYEINRCSSIINSPQAAILAVGAGGEMPLAEQGQVLVRTVATLTLSSDHRILYGADSARFLAALKNHIESPYLLML